MSKKIQQEIIRDWLSEKIRAGGHGTQAKLADFIGIERNVINKILKPVKGKPHQKIKADELVKMAEFFDETPPGFAPVATYPSQRELLDIIQNLSAGEADWLLPFVKVWREQASKAPLPLSPKKEKK